jgi:hypothetical protein
MGARSVSITSRISRVRRIGAVKPACHVGSCFHIRPTLRELHLPSGFYLLRLSMGSVLMARSSSAGDLQALFASDRLER